MFKSCRTMERGFEEIIVKRFSSGKRPKPPQASVLALLLIRGSFPALFIIFPM